MMLQKRQNVYQPASLTPGSSNLLSSTVRFDQFDRSYAWEEMFLIVDFTVGTALTTCTVDGALNVARNINLSINDGKRPRSVVNASGAFLLEYAGKVGLNHPVENREMYRAHAAGTWAASGVYRVVYRIPFVHPLITEPLRTRCLLDVHNHVANPVLTVDFSSMAQMASAGTFTAMTAEVVVIGRDIPASLNDQILKDGGFMQYDILETLYTIPLSTSGTQRFQIQTPGWYSGLLLRQYKGGATVTRAPIDNTTTAGSETKWQLTQGSFQRMEFRGKHIRALNDLSGVMNAASQTSSPEAAGALASNTNYQNPSSIFLDFLTDGMDAAAELGSLLDCNAPSNSVNRTELVCTDVASVATNASLLYVGGHRFYSDNGLVSKWQAVR
jgi:hypothetical protein